MLLVSWNRLQEAEQNVCPAHTKRHDQLYEKKFDLEDGLQTRFMRRQLQIQTSETWKTSLQLDAAVT